MPDQTTEDPKESKVDESTVRMWDIYRKVVFKDFTVFVKALGDTEQKQRVKMALKESRQYRNLLMDSSTEDHQGFLADFADMDRMRLETTIIANRVNEFRSEALLMYPAPAYVPIPTDDEAEEGKILEAKAEAMDARKRAFDEHSMNVTHFIAEKITEFKEYAKSLSNDEVRSIAESHLVERLANGEYQESLARWALYLSCYDDDRLTERTFANADQVGSKPPQFRNKLYQTFLEVNTIDPLS